MAEIPARVKALHFFGIKTRLELLQGTQDAFGRVTGAPRFTSRQRAAQWLEWESHELIHWKEDCIIRSQKQNPEHEMRSRPLHYLEKSLAALGLCALSSEPFWKLLAQLYKCRLRQVENLQGAEAHTQIHYRCPFCSASSFCHWIHQGASPALCSFNTLIRWVVVQKHWDSKDRHFYLDFLPWKWAPHSYWLSVFTWLKF